MADDALTLTDPTAAGKPRAPAAPLVFALVVVWCADEPERLGETLVVSGEGWSAIGRGGGSSTDAHPRLQPVRVRPGGVHPAPPLGNPRLSRVQVRVRSRPPDGIEFERAGRAALFHGASADEVDRGLVRPGETLQVGRHLLLLAVRRPAWLPAADVGRPVDELPFGAADPLGLVGESPALWALRERIAFVARRREHVLVLGASGVGKEMVARAVHGIGSTRPIVARNAATIPEGLVDAELFGNARNYPQAGMAERPGLIGEAHGSTLFLDEFGELPRALQVHLLRVLDAGEYQRLGESHVRQSQFRLVAATNRPASVFKEDVLARLPLRIEVPDLNERREDIPLLARHVLRAIGGRDGETAAPAVSLDLTRALLGHQYTTNVRELHALLLEALAHRSGTELDWIPPALHLSPAARPSNAAAPAAAEARLAELQPARLQAALDGHRGSVEHTRRALGLSSRHVLARLIARHGLRAGRDWRPPAQSTDASDE